MLELESTERSKTRLDRVGHSGRGVRIFLALVALCAGLFLSVDGRAQDLPDLQLQRFRPATGPADYLTVYSTGVAEPWNLSGAFYIDIADGTLRLATSESRNNEVVKTQMTASALGNIGLPYGMEVGLLVPGTLLQTTEDLTPVAPDGATLSPSALSTQGLNDFRLSYKYQAINLLTKDHGLAFVSNFYIPVGTKNTFTSDGGFSFDLLAVYETWLWRGSRVAANLGYRFRSEPATFRSASMGDEILWSVGLNIPIFIQNVDLITELDGSFSIARDDLPGSGLHQGESPTEFRTAARVALSPDWAMTLGIGTRLGDGVGVPDVRGMIGIGGYWVSGGRFSFDYDHDGIYGAADQCPDGTEDHDQFEDSDGCPDPDNDKDGVLDVNDQCRNTPKDAVVDSRGCVENDIDGDGIPNDRDTCPEDPEDYDDFEDADGCPDPDNDKDGIADLADKCPNEKETRNNYNDEDGCPDKPGEHVRVVNENIVLNHKVHFETGKATIKEESHDVLDELAQVIKDIDDIELVRVEGHTDNQGAKKMNRKLSQRRAESVRNYLVEQGVSPKRLAATGFGESQPIATNKTSKGRAKNRRVEFKILKRDED